MGWLFRGHNGNNHAQSTHRRRLSLPDYGKGGESPRFPIIRDPDGNEMDSSWDFVEEGLDQGWLRPTGEHFLTTRNNESAFGIIFYLLPLE